MLRLLTGLFFLLFLSTGIHSQTTKSRVSGYVFDGKQPLPGAKVSIQPGNYLTATDLQGYFELDGIQAGTYSIEVKYIGYISYLDTLDFTDGNNYDLGSLQLSPDAVVMKEALVSGQLKRGTDAKAINMIRTAPRVVTVLSAEAISKLPDKNAAETVMRLAGVAVQKDKGEGSYASLRGTPVDWTSTLLNGDRMPVADEENVSRTFEFEVLPSDLIDYVVVSRSITPDIEGDNIGGAMNFLTKAAVDERNIRINLSGGYSFLAEKPVVNAGISYGDRVAKGKFGFILNASYFGRYYTAHNYKLAYGSNFNHGINRLELKDYNGMKNTIGANAAFEYKPADWARINVRFLYSAMLDDKYQNKTMYNYSEGSGQTVRLQNIHGKLNRQIVGGSIQSVFKIADHMELEFKLASYYNSFKYGPYPFKGKNDPRNGYFAVEFVRKLLGQDGYSDRDYITLYGGIPDTTGGNTSDAFITKLIGKDNPYGKGDDYRKILPQLNVTLQPNDFNFSQAFSELNRTIEQDPIVAQLDYRYKISSKVTLTAGMKWRMKTGSRDLSLFQWLQNPNVYPGVIRLTQFDTKIPDDHGGFLRELGSPYAGTFMPFFTKDQLGSFINQMGDTLKEYPMNVLNLEYLDFIGSSYTYSENVLASYLMADVRLGKHIQLVGGVRLENTWLKETADTIGTELAFDSLASTYYYPKVPQTINLSYLAILPTVNMTYTINDKMNLRAAISRTFHRPNFAQTKPGFAQFSYTGFEFNFGNPNLKPTFSWNFDIMYEYFWGNKGMFSVGAYYKYVTNHIFATMEADNDPSTGIVYKSYKNAPYTFVAGAEIMFKRKFDFLPKFLSGLGLDANFTYSYSRMQVPGREKKQAMPEQTPILYNIAIFYEKYGVNARLALNYTGPFLHELNLAAVKSLSGNLELLHKDSSFDLFHAENYSMDMQVSYDFKKHYSVFIEANNLLNFPHVMYRGERSRPYITEYYRQRIMGGIRIFL